MRTAAAQRWAACTALSLLMHAAVWWVLHPAIGLSGQRRGAMPASAHTRTASPVTVVHKQPHAQTGATAQPPTLSPIQPPSPRPQAATAAMTMAVTAAPGVEQTPPDSPQPSQVAVVTELAETDRDSAGAETADALFLPTATLDSPPEPLSAIDLHAPEGMPDGTFKAEATLFIDEQGHVLRLRIDQADRTGLPALLEEQVYRTFLSATFLPGQKDGQPVKSQMRIEVEFSTEPPPPPTETGQPGR